MLPQSEPDDDEEEDDDDEDDDDEVEEERRRWWRWSCERVRVSFREDDEEDPRLRPRLRLSGSSPSSSG